MIPGIKACNTKVESRQILVESHNFKMVLNNLEYVQAGKISRMFLKYFDRITG
jgi:hypothetical protein